MLTTIDKSATIAIMSTNTMSFALPGTLRAWIDERVRSGQYGNTSEYLRDLVRKDQEDQAKQRFRALIQQGLESGPARPLTTRVVAELRSLALNKKR